MDHPDRRRRPVREAAIALALALVLGIVSGCSSGDEGADAPTPDEEPAEATPTSAPVGSPGCGRPADVDVVGDALPGDVEQSIEVAGTERTYRLAVPEGYDPDRPAPLVLNLHGSGSDALQASIYGQVPRAASEAGMLVVAPDAIDGRWELGGEGVDADVLDALLDDVEARYCVDEDRVHAVGMSLGAWKAAVTACASGDRFASLSLVTVEVFPGECAPMPVIAFHGTADPVVAYGEGGGTVDDASTPNAGIPPTLTNVAAWARSGGCDPEPEVEAVGDDVELRRYIGCDEGVDVELYTIDGGGHTWPGSAIVIGPPEWTTDTIDATALTLAFFEEHPRP